MKLPSFRSYRSKLIIVLCLTILLVFGYGFYVHIATLNLQAIFDKPIITNEDVVSFGEIITSLSRFSFFFTSFILVVVVTLLIYIVLSLSFSLSQILDGIEKIANGDFSYQIPLKGKNEFVTIATFLNSASSQLGTARRELLSAKESVEKQVKLRTSELQAERNKMSVVLSGITDSVIALDLQRNIVMFNTNAELLTGFTTSQVLGHSISQVVEFFEGKNSLSIDEYAPVKSDGFEGIVFVKENVKLVSVKGKVAWVRLTVSQIREGNEVNLGNILTIRDRTREHQLEEMKLDFVSMAAHELRTPLTSMKGYLSVFVNENKGKFEGDSQMLLNRVAISTDQLSGLIENILNVSRIEKGIYAVHPENVDWIALVEHCVSDVLMRAQEKQLVLTFTKPTSPLPMVSVDKVRIVEVLYNLLSNSINYTPKGGTITISLEATPSMIITHVKDTGKGMATDVLPHLFTKFYRAGGPISDGVKGTGLGLYIAKAIVELHRGKIWVESEAGHGSTFSFSLPIAKKQEAL